MPTTIYGIKTCDTVKKARSWLGAHGISHTFHDFRVDGLDGALLEDWSRKVGWEVLLNKASATFRGLAESEKSVLDHDKALKLMLAYPTLIKRPVLDTGRSLTVGFQPARYAEVTAAS